MPSRRITLYRLYLVFVIAIIWVLFSLLFFYNIVEVNRELLQKRTLITLAIVFAIIGFIAGGAEAFFLKHLFRKFPLWLSTILRMTLTLLLFLFVSVVFLSVYFIFSYNGTLREFTDIFIQTIFLTPSFLMLMIDLGVLAFLSILILEVNDKYGPGGIFHLLVGRYNKPRNEDRIFLFLDINDSTTIAERLGHEKYFNMLKDFFADISDPILSNSGHIYQYIGDEISVSWENTIVNKLRCLAFVQEASEAIEQRKNYYQKMYDVAPTFKTGVHAGDVTAGYIGIIKKELVFSGDTLNTAARIRSKCHELNESFVVSAEFLSGVANLNGFVIAEIGEMELRGRMEKEKLFSVRFA